MITETANVDWAVRDEYASYGKHRLPAVAAASYGEDTMKLMASDLDAEFVRLQARCAFRFARLALGESK